MKPEAVRLFVYGTLLEADVCQWVFGRQPEGKPDVLPGHVKKERSVAGRYPEVCPTDQPGQGVSGRCLELSPEDLQRADAYETALYYRAERTLASGSRAWVYLAAREQNQTK
ncbi:gamma-glutamylcyclotransferase [Robiginitalea sp. M366]|uniref:gamma-glutamylcyclotransferase family protein n=1 Tax=Robiginitalea aestuariiviva TaxID=3036903 RepID=UPI00240D08E1|nr:gamma-glutamylcyclotransferase family protein [Robiginitalea aestuariiviva]MDG1571189.1 gamma-glutamylcyclotransferase [Robiginitalea aestuariiviva]